MKLIFDAIPVTLDAAAGEESPRTITGLAIPWDTPAVLSGGERVLVRRGAFNVESKPKLLEGHDLTQLRGTVTELADSEEGLLFTAKFAKTRAADDAIELSRPARMTPSRPGSPPRSTSSTRTAR